MTDQKNTKEIMVSSPNRYGKNFQSLNESIAYASQGKDVLCASTTGVAVMISREKYDTLRTQLDTVTNQRDELRVMLEKCASWFGGHKNKNDFYLDILNTLARTKGEV